MVKNTVRRNTKERGQAVVLVILSLSIFMLGAMGLAIDGSQLYAQRQMAQSAADAAAQAGIVTIFNGGTAIGTTAYYCTAANTTSPCTYAAKNGYTAGTCTSSASAAVGADCIKVDPNPGVAVPSPGVLDPSATNEVQVTVTRAVPMTLMKLMGFSSLNVTARATAAIVDVAAPVPIIVTHPWMADALDLSGSGSNVKITIFGGPPRSIQVNSTNPLSLNWNGNPTIDLSKAGPFGTGADLGDFGGAPADPVTTAVMSPLGTTEHFVFPADPILDPLASISPPSQPAYAAAPTPLANGVSGCPASPAKACVLYYPGTYDATHNGDINVMGQTAVFSPGIYYMYGTNFQTNSNGYVQMATGLTDTTTGTSWTGNMMVYMTGPTTTTIGSGKSACSPASPAANTGSVSIGANGSVNMTGSPTSSSYKGILFFVDRSAVSAMHSLGGGPAMTLVGTVYMTDTVGQMGQTSSATCGQYQTLTMGGNSGSTTNITGEIIVSALTLGGSPGITMNLSPDPLTIIRQIALINGE
jgi:Flp pilus assembly protein TadG